MTKIILIRHGKPSFELKGKAQSKDIKEITRNYDLSGISEESPKISKEMALTCNVVVCSDFNRSIDSAKALGFNEIHLSDPIFREVAIPYFRGGSFKMPVSAWAIFLRCMSVVGFSRNGESISMAKSRAKIATEVLIDIAQNHESTLLVGHYFINYFIAKELLSRNWVGPSKPDNGYWEYTVYNYNAT